MFKKILCLTLSLCLLCTTAVTAFAEPEEKTVTVSTPEELLELAENCRLDTYSQGLTVSLEADIDLADTDFTPIPIFSGKFLGNGHMVSGVNITADGSHQGFFRYLTATARVEKLNITGKVIPGGSRSDIGGIAGSNAGYILNCSFSGTVEGRDRVGGIVGSNAFSGVIENTNASGNISGNHFVGGVAGENDGVIRYCENTAFVNTEAKQNNVDISDVTVDTVTGTEAANAVTDVGGIAGSSAGVIRGCANYGNVGYPHMGYNIGGIAGSLTGHLTNCENFSAVSGRKEVGGIVGQMEPAILLQYETDTFQILEGQLGTLGALVDRMASNAKNSTDSVKASIANIEDCIAQAQAVLDSLTGATDPDSVLAAMQELGECFSGIQDSLQSLTQTLETVGTQLESDLNAITAQTNVIQATVAGGEENLGGSVVDVSDQDTEEDYTGKVSASNNYGAVTGDRNIGGVAGAMALENDLDPEEDVTVSGGMTLNATGQLRSVILRCENRGEISARKQNVGGIVGWQSLGLVKDSVNLSTLNAATADYAGGIAGQSDGYIRNCSAKTVITAKTYVGGIAGSGTVVTDCHSLGDITGSECVGGILGFANNTDAEQPVANNTYVAAFGDMGGIDGISYSGVAVAVPQEEFFAKEGLPEDFQKVTVTFCFDDGTVTRVDMTAGQCLTAQQIPNIPAQDGQLARWENIDVYMDKPVFWDLTFQPVHSGHGYTLASRETFQEKPILLLQGDFSVNSVLTTTPMEQVSAPVENAVLVDALYFTVTDAAEVTTARYLLPATEKDNLQVYVLDKDGAWRPVSHTMDGSYMVFPAGMTDRGFAVWAMPANLLPWIIGGISVVVLAGAITIWVVIAKKKTREDDEYEDYEE